MEYLYHGSGIAGIRKLEACSRLHGTDRKVVYLTDNIPYALLYIWDEKHNGCREKHVTGGIKNGIVYYEEQFPDQLQTFYRGVSGYLYCVLKTPDTQTVESRECMYYDLTDMAVSHVIDIPDVYESLMKYKASGALKIRRYTQQPAEKQDELIDRMAAVIAENDFFRENEEMERFYKRHFGKAWERAMVCSKGCV